MDAPLYIGTAGWSLPAAEQGHFASAGSHLERYASRFAAVEINSTFHRPHRQSTFARWAASVPASFRFSVKVPKAITHEARLAAPAVSLLEEFLGEVHALGSSLGCLLIQLPPSLEFKAVTASRFLTALRSRYDGSVAVEPRHETWFTPAVDRLLRKHRAARVAADPARTPAAAEPGGWPDVVYYRLHGSPRMYYSAYDATYLDALAASLRARRDEGVPVWCILDNTTLGAATRNARELLDRVG